MRRATLGTHIPVVTSLLSAEAELSRTTPFVCALLIGLVGCARDAEVTDWLAKSDIQPPRAVTATSDRLPAAFDDTTVVETSPRTSLVRDFAAAIAERTRCGRRPDKCAVSTITAEDSEYRSFLTKLMAERDAAGFRTLPGEANFGIASNPSK